MYYDIKSSDAGDPIWLYNPKEKKGILPKLFQNWEGLYTAVKPSNDLVYHIQLGPRTKQKMVHWNRRGSTAVITHPNGWNKQQLSCKQVQIRS